MPSDKTHRREATETGVMPHIEIEPMLHREAPTPPLPEIIDDAKGAKTGVMPIVPNTGDDNKTLDEDTPKGSKL